MGTTLQQTLRGLCYKTGWHYAVFWKLMHGTRMTLAWEDGYCEYAKTSAVSNVSAYMVPSFPLNGMECGQEGAYAQDGFSVGDQISRAVAQMSCQMFLFGEDIIGRVAFTGKHQWIFGDKNGSNESNSFGSVCRHGMLDYPIGWQNQFVAGIKTIAVIPVMPHGVLQLGSTRMVRENLEFVNNVKDMFDIFQNFPKMLLPYINQDGLRGKIQGSFLPTVHIPLTSSGNAASPGAINKPSFEHETNKSVTKLPGSDVLDQIISPTNLMVKNKRLPAHTVAAPCVGSAGASTGTVNHPSSSQQNHLNNLLAHIADAKATETSKTKFCPSASRVYPFEGQMPVNVSLPDSQQTLIMSTSNTFMEQLQYQGKMTSDFQEDSILNSICESAEPVIAERFCQNRFNTTEKNDRVLGNAVDVQTPISIFQDNIGQPGYSSIAARLLACSINRQDMSTISMPLHKVNPEKISYNSPSLSSANIGMTISDPRQSSDAQWSVSDRNPSTKMLEGLSNGLATSVGYEEISVSDTHGTDHPSWHKEIIPKDMPELLHDNDMHIVNPVKENSESAIADLGRFSSILAGFDNSGSDYHAEVDATKKSDVSIVTATEGWFLSQAKSEDLLDAVVGNRCLRTDQGGDENMSCKTTFSSTTNSTSLYYASPKSNNCSARQLNVCEKTQSEILDVSTSREKLDLGNCTNPNFPTLLHDDIGLKMSPNESSTNAQPKYLVNKTQCESQGLAQTKRPGEPIKTNRKRARPGESPRPRPKDRQQIQDRLKELRDIIPNGTKGSIDTLLERTIKHMRFLQSVTKYADKLKLSGKSKVLDEEGPLHKMNVDGGASWAFELGGKTVGCPVIVEDLNQPRQMLVEMLCEERGLFLEIADIIRNLGLTILKGIMESRNDKIWAHFVVEANRDVHRVEILWSLMQLLQPNTKSSSTTTNQSSLINPQGIDNVSETFDAFQLSPISTLLSNGIASGS